MNTQSADFLNTQYENAQNLDIRIQLHERYSHAEQDWHHWVFDHFDFEGRQDIIEFGCGSGKLWEKNRDRVQQEWRVILSDRSEGMLNEAKQSMSDKANFSFEQVDVQHTGLTSASFDMAIANHMLYHVPDRAKALLEIRRLLRSDGVFYAAANGRNHMGEIYEWVRDFDSTLPFAQPGNADNFGLENGQALLSNYFAKVNVVKYASGLKVTAVSDLIEYLFSMNADLRNAVMSRGIYDDLGAYLEKRKNGKPYLSITKESGLFVSEMDS